MSDARLVTTPTPRQRALARQAFKELARLEARPAAFTIVPPTTELDWDALTGADTALARALQTIDARHGWQADDREQAVRQLSGGALARLAQSNPSLLAAHLTTCAPIFDRFSARPQARARFWSAARAMARAPRTDAVARGAVRVPRLAAPVPLILTTADHRPLTTLLDSGRGLCLTLQRSRPGIDVALVLDLGEHVEGSPVNWPGRTHGAGRRYRFSSEATSTLLHAVTRGQPAADAITLWLTATGTVSVTATLAWLPQSGR
jgi:hypothetical protein